MSDQETLEFLRRLGEQHSRPRRAARRKPNFFAGDWNGTGFAGAKINRTNEDWDPGTVGPNRVHQMDGRRLRERARDLVINNPLALSAVDSYIVNVVERGITPKAKFDDADQRKLWTSEWELWGGCTPVSESEADITGHDSIYALQALWLREVIVAGGCLVHYVELPRGGSHGRRLPLAIELIPEERITDERDTHLYPIARNQRKTANPIIQGVEIEQSSGRPVAYWVKPTIPNDYASSEWEPIRLPADQCCYGFFRNRIGQYRGHTLLHAIIMWLWRLGYYTDAELLASQMKSNWAYMIETAADADFDWPSLEDSYPTSGATDIYGNRIEKTEAGMIWRGAKGDKISAVGPNVPGGDSLPWIKLIEQSISIGVGLSRFELTRDGADANFSSLRACTNADRRRYRPVQQFAINKFCNPTWRRFAMVAARMGLDGFPRQSEFAANMHTYLAVSWRPPGWLSVNPVDDANADDIKIKNRTRTREDVIAAEGGDWESSFEQMDREEQRLEELGLQPDGTDLKSERPQSQQTAADSMRGGK